MHSLRTAHVLLVDDDESICRTLELILGKKGHRTETARSACQAVEKAKKGFFNVALLETGLPDMEGTELVGPLKAIHPDLEVILLTGHGSVETAVQALNQGAFAYIIKPLNMAQVLLTVEQAMEKQRLVKEKRWAEEAAQEAREYAESIVGTVREPLVVLDADLRVVSANRSFYQTFKVASEETQGQLLYDLGNREWDTPKLRELLEEVLPQNTLFNDFRVEHHFENVGQRTMLLNARRLYREVNNTQMILLGIEDITERKEAEEALHKAHQELAARVQELAKANEEMQSFIYSISHDLRMPLVAVQGFTNLLKEEYGDDLKGEAEHYLSAIVQSTGKMSDLIEELLQLSRVGQMDTEPEEVALESLVEAITTELKVETPKRKLNFRIKDPLPETYCNRKRLYQVFSNLLGNAVKFTRNLPEAKIEVGVKKKGDKKEFYVQDNGPGIDPQYHEEVFKAFRRLHGSGYEGSGMGLTFVKKIVESWGGNLRLESKPGKGATFYFTIPEAQKSNMANSKRMTSDSSGVTDQVHKPKEKT